MTTERFSCTDCSIQSCYRRNKPFPSKCLSIIASKQMKDMAQKHYTENGIDKPLAIAAAEIEGKFYGKLTRVEEIIQFALAIGANKIGIATCIGLITEAKTFASILRAHGLKYFSVICKVESVDKTSIGIPEELKVLKGSWESICNPVLQASILNHQKCDLNVIVGLCVGHDALFNRHSEAPVTTLITKDRVLGHNPAAALYTSNFYYKRLFPERK